MPKKTYKYNCACEAKIHTNNTQVFRLHVGHCPICQEKLPPEILDSLEPQLSQLIQSYGEKRAPRKVEPPKIEKEEKPEIPFEIEKAPPKPAEMLVAPDLDSSIRNLPSIQGLAKSVADTKRDIGRVSSRMEDGFRGLTDEFKTLGEALQTLISTRAQIPSDTPPLDTGEKVELSPEAKREAKDIRKEMGLEEPPLKAPPHREAPPEHISPKDIPPLDSREQLDTLENFLAQEKRRMGLEGAGARPTREKEGIPFIGEATEAIKQIRGVIDAARGKTEERALSLPEITAKLLEQILTSTVASASKKKDAFDGFVEGIKAQNDSFTNAINALAKFKGGGGFSPDDIKKVVREEIARGRGIEPPSEHLTGEE